MSRPLFAALAVAAVLTVTAGCSQQPTASPEPPPGGAATSAPAPPTEQELRDQLLSSQELATDGWTQTAEPDFDIPYDSGDPCTGDPIVLDSTAGDPTPPSPVVTVGFERSYEEADGSTDEASETVFEILAYLPGAGQVVEQQRAAWAGCQGEPIEAASYEPPVAATPIEVEAGMSAPACVLIAQPLGSNLTENIAHFCLVELSGDRILTLYVEARTNPEYEVQVNGSTAVPTPAPEVEENFNAYLDAAVSRAG